ncbi:hypothetical protein BT63DRAFT_438930 [Microthyrium microscopicum]|uniref:Uncharacterized protein n=1 Tax=Microthyrium microscopicum TaxID=703497 RepID=A0A6A6UJ66_9PEZI|nr:hypothetical protein BT63DRAFT_438930 [Microthyrium microscopicum]
MTAIDLSNSDPIQFRRPSQVPDSPSPDLEVHIPTKEFQCLACQEYGHIDDWEEHTWTYHEKAKPTRYTPARSLRELTNDHKPGLPAIDYYTPWSFTTAKEFLVSNPHMKPNQTLFLIYESWSSRPVVGLYWNRLRDNFVHTLSPQYHGEAKKHAEDTKYVACMLRKGNYSRPPRDTEEDCNEVLRDLLLECDRMEYGGIGRGRQGSIPPLDSL